MTGTPWTKELKLTPKQERYVKARAQGMVPLEAMRFAGFSIREDVKESTLIAKASKYDRQPFIEAAISRIVAKENMQNAAKKMATIADAVEAFDPEEVNMSMINSAAMATFRRALDVDNFGSALATLKFLAQANGLASPVEKGKPGRPSTNHKTPNEMSPEDTKGNYDYDNDGEAAEGEVGDSLFDAFGGGAGAVAAHKTAPGPKAAAGTPKHYSRPEPEPEDVDVDGGFDEFDDSDVGTPGEDGGPVS